MTRLRVHFFTVFRAPYYVVCALYLIHKHGYHYRRHSLKEDTGWHSGYINISLFVPLSYFVVQHG